MKIEVEITKEQIIKALEDAPPVNSAASLVDAPSRIVAWCVYAVGAEWRECVRNGKGEYTHTGHVQNITHWIPYRYAP